MMGCGWWNPPTPYKEDCYWYREEQDMNAHIPYCTCKNQFPLNTCENCDDYHSRNRRTRGDKIRSMSDEELACFISKIEVEAIKRAGRYLTKTEIERGKLQRLDWLRQEGE